MLVHHIGQSGGNDPLQDLGEAFQEGDGAVGFGVGVVILAQFGDYSSEGVSPLTGEVAKGTWYVQVCLIYICLDCVHRPHVS